MADTQFLSDKPLTMTLTLGVGTRNLNFVRATDGAILICHPKFLWGHENNPNEKKMPGQFQLSLFAYCYCHSVLLSCYHLQ